MAAGSWSIITCTLTLRLRLIVWVHRCHHSDRRKIPVGLGTAPLFWNTLNKNPRKCKHRTELMEAELQGKELSCALKPFVLVGWFFTYLLNGSCIVFANIMSAPTRRTQDTFFPPTICQLYSQKCRGRCDVLGYTGWRRKAGSSQEMAKQGRAGNSLGRKDEVQGSGQKSIVLNFEKSKESKSKKRYILISKRRSPKSRKASPI